MGCFSKKDIAAAATLQADARGRITDIADRTESATTAAEHTQLGRERASAFGDLKSATFILTEDGAS
jgi:hypothetical protein